MNGSNVLDTLLHLGHTNVDLYYPPIKSNILLELRRV